MLRQCSMGALDSKPSECPLRSRPVLPGALAKQSMIFHITLLLALPGASAKQSTIFHITLLRVLSPQQLSPADVAAVQAAVDAAAAPLVGLRFVPRHMLYGPASIILNP